MQKRALELQADWSGIEATVERQVREAKETPLAKGQRIELPGTLLLPGLREKLRPTDDDLHALIYTLEIEFGRSYRRREALELLLWQVFVTGAGDKKLAKLVKEALEEISDASGWSCLSTDEMNVFDAEVKQTPLIFISVPWAQAQSPHENWANWESQIPVVFHSMGKPSPAAEDLALRQQEEFYPVVMYMPSTLAKHQELRTLAGQLFARLLLSGIWYVGPVSNADWSRRSEETTLAQWEDRILQSAVLLE